MIPKIVICGRGGSGKDFLRRKYEKRGFIYQPQYTSRIPREGETSGVDFNFITNRDVLVFLENDEWYTLNKFYTGYYGTTKFQFYSKFPSVFILNPLDISMIKPEDRKKTFIIYLCPSDEDSFYEKRMKQRGDSDETIQTRILKDRETFKNFKDFDICIKNLDF